MITDTERLDWLARNGQSARQWGNGWLTLIRWHGRKVERPKTLRRSIDAAIYAERELQSPAVDSHSAGFLRARL